MCKLYLSAILNLYDWRIVSYVLSERNDNLQGFKTFDKAAQANPDADSLFLHTTEDSSTPTAHFTTSPCRRR